MAKVTDGVTATHYVYDTRYRVIEERDGEETLLARYTYGSGMDEPLTMERDGQTYYYHRDALGSITEVTDESGDLVERYEYDVYGAVTIFDGAGVTLTASAINNPYLFTARRYDLESGNYTYRARIYSPWLGRFLSMDPIGFDAGDYNLYRYVFNNPVNATDPTGEFAFIPWLAKASAEAAADALMQAAIAYFFDPTVTSVSEAIGSVDLLQVGGAFFVGLLPFGGLAKSVLEAAGEVVLNALEALGSECKDYTPEQALFDFATGIVFDLAGDKIADLIVDYGLAAVQKGLKKLGIADALDFIARKLGDVCSFSEDTLVSTEDGLQAISTFEVGDYVLAYDEANDQIGYYPIIGVWAHEDPVVVHLTIDGELIETTPEHPFYTAGREWVAAGELQVGDEVRQADGSYGVVEAVEFVYRPQTMYNFTVAGAHTYFVGDGQWLVHNKCDFFRKKHAALGTNEGLKLADFSINTRSYQYGMWHEGGLLDHPANTFNFDADFKTAMDRAEHIHFDLDGIWGDWEDFRQLGAGGEFGGAPFTAVELYLVTINPDWHAKTTFYVNGKPLQKSPFEP